MRLLLKPKTVTQNVINSDYSNPYALWKKQGCPQTPTPQQIMSLQDASRPTEENAEYEYNSGYITLEISLSANEIKRIIIK